MESNYQKYWKGKKYAERYRKKHPLKAKAMRAAYQANLRAKKFGSTGKLAAKDVEQLFITYGSKCLACGSPESITIDHVTPLAVGGLNQASNLQVLCTSCNEKKSTKTTDYR